MIKLTKYSMAEPGSNPVHSIAVLWVLHPRSARSTLSNIVAPSHMWPFKLQLNKIKFKVQFLTVVLATCQVFRYHMWLLATILGWAIETISIVPESSVGQDWSR